MSLCRESALRDFGSPFHCCSFRASGILAALFWGSVLILERFQRESIQVKLPSIFFKYLGEQFRRRIGVLEFKYVIDVHGDGDGDAQGSGDRDARGVV